MKNNRNIKLTAFEPDPLWKTIAILTFAFIGVILVAYIFAIIYTLLFNPTLFYPIGDFTPCTL